MQSSDETLVRMANDIAKFFRAQGEDRAVPGITDHLKKFWEPRMKRAIFAYVDHGGNGLDPLAAKAVASLKEIYAGSPLIATDAMAKPAAQKVAQVSQQPKAKASGKGKGGKVTPR